MSNIVKHQASETAIFKKPNALQEVEETLLVSIRNALLNCYFELNQVVPPNDELNILVNKILDSILEKYSSMRAEEIGEAFSKGIRRVYGEYYGICLISCEQFIEGYLASPERKEKIQQHYKSLEQKTEPTADEKFTTAKNLTLEAFAQVSKGRNPGLTAVTVYTFLNEIGLVPKDYKKGVYRPALDELLQDKEKEIAFCLDPIRRRILNTRIEEFRQNIEKDLITPEQHEEVLRTGKRMILISLMRDWVLDEVNVSELIEGKRQDYKNSRA